MTCAICNKEIPEGNRYCPNCGAAVEPAGAAYSETTAADMTAGAAAAYMAAGAPAPEPAEPAATAAVPTEAAVTGTAPAAAAAAPELEPLPGEFHTLRQMSGPETGSGTSLPTGAGADPGRVYGAPRRRGRTALIVTLIVLVLLAGSGFVVYRLYGRDIRRMLAGPKKSYLLMEAAALKNSLTDLAGDLADTSKKNSVSAAGAEADISVQLSTSLPGIDENLRKAINGLKLQVKSLMDNRQAEPKMYVREDLIKGNDALVGVELFLDEDRLVLGVPGLIEEYIVIPMDTLSPEGSPLSGVIPFQDYLKQQFEQAPLIDKVQLAASFSKMVDVFLAHMDTVTFTNQVNLTAGSVTAPYECYTVTTGGRQLRDMAVGMLELIRDEKPLNDLFFPYFRNILASGMPLQMPFDSAGYGEFEDLLTSGKPLTEAEWKQMLDKLIGTLKALKDEELDKLTFTQRVYVDKQDQVHGREFTLVKASEDQESITVKFLAPFKDNQQVMQISLAAFSKARTDNTDIQFIHQYETKNGLNTGTIDFVTDSKTVLKAVYRDVGTKPLNGIPYLTGEADLNFDAETFNSEMPIPKITLKGEVTDKRYIVNISAVNLANITIDMASIDAANVSIPSLDGKTLIQADDEEALAELMTFSVQIRAMQILSELGIDLSAMMPY